MTNQCNNRSVTARDITGSTVITGDNSNATTRMSQRPLPPPGTVDASAELAALRELLKCLNVPERGKLDRALQDADEGTAKTDPDKEEAAGALSRVVKYAKAASDFYDHVEKLLPHITTLSAWLGSHGPALLAMVGGHG